MKFSELDQEQWTELKPYLDTCLIPVTGLTGAEAPWQAVAGLEKLRDMLVLLEQPFKGRMVTYPAYHYVPDNWQLAAQVVDELCRTCKQEQFCHAVVVSAVAWPEEAKLAHADLLIDVSLAGNPGDLPLAVQEKVRQMWNKNQGTDKS